MTLNEAETRAKLIDPAIHVRGWTDDLICREESAGQAAQAFTGVSELHTARQVDGGGEIRRVYIVTILQYQT